MYYGRHVLKLNLTNSMIQCDHAKINEYDIFYKYRGRLGLSDRREHVSRPCARCTTGTVLPGTQ